MHALPAGLTAGDVLQILKSDSPLLFLGSAVATTGLVAAALAAVRRKNSALLLYFAVFAMLYGARMCIQTATGYYLFGGSPIFTRLREAINFVVPLPAFLF